MNSSSAELDDLALANVEALADGEYYMYDDDDGWDFFDDIFNLDYNVKSQGCINQTTTTTSGSYNNGANISRTGLGTNFGGTLNHSTTTSSSSYERICVGGNYEECTEIDCMGNETHKK